MNIKSKEELAKTSLTFVIDVTGSMWDNIEAVQKAMKEVVRKAQSSSVKPYNYILVTFNDPGKYVCVVCGGRGMVVYMSKCVVLKYWLY